MSNDKETAEIELDSKFVEGKYNVTVERDGEQDLTGSVQVEDETVDGIEVLSNEAPVELDESGEVNGASTGYQVTNQYGEDITKGYGPGLTAEVSGAATDADLKADGTVDFTGHLKGDAEVGDTVHLTLIDESTGESTTQEIELSDEAKATDVAFGEIYNEDGKTLSQDIDTDEDSFYLPIEVEDQYGDAVTDLGDVNDEVIITNTNPGTLEFKDGADIKKVEIDGEDVLALEVKEVKAFGDIDVLAIAKTTGNKDTATVNVAEGTKVDSLGVQAPSEMVTQGKDALFPVTVMDTDGNEVTTKKALDKLHTSVETSEGEIVEKDDALYVEVDGGEFTKDEPFTVVVTAGGDVKPATQTVTPNAAIHPEAVTGLDDDADTTVRAKSGASVDIKTEDIQVQDQYGQVMSDDDLAAILDNDENDYSIKAEADDALVKVDGTNNTISGSDDSITVEYNNRDNATASPKVEFTLYDGDTNDEDNVVSGSKLVQEFDIAGDFESYQVDDADNPVYVDSKANANDTDRATGDYREEVVVKGETDNGVTKKLDTDDYTVKSSNLTFAEDDNKTYVDGIDPDAFSDSTDDKDETVTGEVTVTINATGDTFTKEVDVSNVSPKVETIEVREDGDKNKDIKEQIDVGNTLDVDSVVGYLYGEDQYGAEYTDNEAADGNNIKKDDVQLTFTDVKSDNGEISQNGKNGAEITGLEKGDSAQVKVEVGNAETKVKAVAQKGVIEEEEEQQLIDDQAESITSDNITVEQDDTELDLDGLVDENYTATVATSSDEEVIKTDGEIVPPQSEETVDVSFDVSKDGVDYTATSNDIEITVPQSSGAEALETIQGYVGDDASELTVNQLETAGVENVDSDNLDAYQAAVAGEDSIADLDALQTLINDTNTAEGTTE